MLDLYSQQKIMIWSYFLLPEIVHRKPHRGVNQDELIVRFWLHYTFNYIILLNYSMTNLIKLADIFDILL